MICKNPGGGTPPPNFYSGGWWTASPPWNRPCAQCIMHIGKSEIKFKIKQYYASTIHIQLYLPNKEYLEYLKGSLRKTHSGLGFKEYSYFLKQHSMGYV